MNIKNLYVNLCRKISARRFASAETCSQVCLFAVGIAILAIGLNLDALAASGINYNDDRLESATSVILTFIEGTFGAMIMVGAGLMAIVSSAFGQYRAALSLLVVAVGAFILRSLVHTFFNVGNIDQESAASGTITVN